MLQHFQSGYQLDYGAKNGIIGLLYLVELFFGVVIFFYCVVRGIKTSKSKHWMDFVRTKEGISFAFVYSN